MLSNGLDIRLYSAALAISIGYSIITPYIGNFAREGYSTFIISIMTAAYPVAKAFGFLVSIILTWKPSFRTLLVSAGLAYALMAVDASPMTWGVARFAEGFMFGWFMGVAAQLIAKSSSIYVGESLGWLNSASSAGVFAGPILAWLAISQSQPSLSFVFAALLCLLVALFAKGPTHRFGLPINLSVLKNLKLLIFVFVLFDFTYGVLSIALPLSFVTRPDSGATFTAAIFSAGFVIFLFGLPLFGRLYDRGCVLMLEGGLAAVALIFLAIVIVDARDHLLIGLVILEYVAAAAAYAAATARLGRLSPEGLGIAGALQSVGLALGALAGGFLSSSQLFGLLSGLFAIAFVFFIFTTKAK